MKRKKQKREKSRWEKINDVIFALHLVFPVWLLALMMTPNISGFLFLTALFSTLLLGVIYKLVQKYQRGQKVLLIARIITVCACIALYLPMLLLGRLFSHTKLMYPLKRLDYTYGVYGNNAAYYQQLLPEKLPAVCADYSYRAQGSMLAQDYHPSSYLMFRTDAETVAAYAAYYEGIGLTPTSDEAAAGNLEWFCGQMRLREQFSDNLDHAVLYYISDRYPKGILLNAETGLVAILT